MDLTPAGIIRQNSRINSPAGTETKLVENTKKSANPSQPKDSFSVSQAARDFIEDQKRRQAAQLEQARSMLEKNEEDTDMLDEQLKYMRTCQKIASRVMKGDKVPLKDLKYLMEHDPQLYKMAMTLRQIPSGKKPKKWDSAIEDEEETTENGGETEEASGTSESGGGSGEGGAAAD